jgi:hypothetical protein
MNNGEVLAAGIGCHPVTGWQLLFHFAGLRLIKQGHILHMSPAMVNAHHETGTRDKHQAGEGK